MINPKELRAGNILKGQEFSIPRMGIHSDGTYQITAYGIYVLEVVGSEKEEGVEITDKWLERLGFKFSILKGSTSPSWNIAISFETILTQDSYDRAFYLEKYDEDLYGSTFDYISIPGQVKYVHQLQNLFFSLTGEELTLKDQ